MNAASKPDQADANITSTQSNKSRSQQTEPSMDKEANTLLKEGKSAAVTINTPFTVIPGLPALNRILARIDRTTQQDLGFTFKASAAKVAVGTGKTDDLVIAAHRRTLLDFFGSNFVARRHQAANRQIFRGELGT